MKYDNHIVNEFVPRMGNGFTRWLGSLILKLMGWKITGELPKEKKFILVGAPHTSNWDFILAMACMLSVGLRMSYMMKKEAFFWPFGGLFKRLGGVPIDRSSKTDITGQMTRWFDESEKACLAITPGGTRSKVKSFKKGYLRIAYAANVPVFLLAFNGVTKEVALDRVWPLTYDIEVDNRRIKAHYDKNYVGIRAKNS